MRTLYFQQITDNRFMNTEECFPVLKERVNKIKELLNIEGVEVKATEPQFLDWTKETINWQEKNNIPLDQRLKGESIQYRCDFKVKKTTRKLSWNDIYKLINSVKAVPYKFI